MTALGFRIEPRASGRLRLYVDGERAGRRATAEEVALWREVERLTEEKDDLGNALRELDDYARVMPRYGIDERCIRAREVLGRGSQE